MGCPILELVGKDVEGNCEVGKRWIGPVIGGPYGEVGLPGSFNPLNHANMPRLCAKLFVFISLALGWLLEKIHVTWAHLEKKRTRLRLYTKSLKKLSIQSVVTWRRWEEFIVSETRVSWKHS
ncbi:hypothetical protein Tco_0853767 [Tanacetum coccineum]